MRDAFLTEREAHCVRDAGFACDTRLRRVCGTHRITYHSEAASLITYLLFGSEHKGRLNGIIPEAICGNIMSFVIGLSVASLALYALHCLGAFDKIGQWKKKRRENKH